uniref:Uncharacterized protein n=1 Tax=Anopheles quadriannulatus TaxID=34691 RepID=A0A182XR83_ANOQN
MSTLSPAISSRFRFFQLYSQFVEANKKDAFKKKPKKRNNTILCG